MYKYGGVRRLLERVFSQIPPSPQRTAPVAAAVASREVRRGAGERSEILHLLRETARAEERERELLSQWPNVHFTPHPHPEDLDMYLGTDDADNVKKFYCCEEWG